MHEGHTTHQFELPGSGGAPIRGEVRVSTDGGPLPVVVGVHGFKGFRRWGFWPTIAETLSEAGFAVVTFDLSHNGVGAGGLEFDEPERFEANTWTREEEDLRAVLDAVRGGRLPESERMDTRRLGLVGHSRGGGLVVRHAADDPGVGATVALAPIASMLRFTPDQLAEGRERGFIPIVNSRTGQVLRFGRDAIDELDRRTDLHDLATSYAARLATPLLVCHGTADPAVDPDDGRRLAAAAADARFVPFEGADHVLGCRHPWAGSNPDFDRFLELTTEFLGRHLKR